MKKKITFIGHYAENKRLYDGQTVKTKILFDEIKDTDIYDVEMIDTHNWKNNIYSLVKRCKNACKNDDYVIMMPDLNGFRALVRMLPFFNKKKNCKLIYVVVGGWLSAFLKKNPKYVSLLNEFDAIIVETECLKYELEHQNVHNTHIIPNFKRLDIVKTLAPVAKYPYRFCTFSRVMKEKGIEDAIECIKRINEKYDNDIVTLDIYGQIEENYKDEFERIMKNVPKYIRYKGIVEFENSVEILKDYYAMLFPTTYYAECLAGTVIDAFASGLPVIAYDWPSGHDLISNGVEGWLCKAEVDELIKAVEFAINDQDMMLEMRINCVKKAKEYTPDVNIQKLIKILMEL